MATPKINASYKVRFRWLPLPLPSSSPSMRSLGRGTGRRGRLGLLVMLWPSKSSQKLALADALQVQVSVVVLAAIEGGQLEAVALDASRSRDRRRFKRQNHQFSFYSKFLYNFANFYVSINSSRMIIIFTSGCGLIVGSSHHVTGSYIITIIVDSFHSIC